MTFDRRELERLSDKVIEGTVSPQEFGRLKSIVLHDDMALSHHVDYLFNHAALSFGENAKDEALRSVRFIVDGQEDRHQYDPPASRCYCSSGKNDSRKHLFSIPVLILFPVLLLSIVFSLFVVQAPRKEEQFVLISKTTNCLWGDSTTQTLQGTRLGPGTLHLEQGIALLYFDCGVSASIEGPCVFEIVGKKHAVLHHGRLVVEVERNTGKGFLVDSPHVIIKDHGTKFAVYAPQSRPNMVFVLDGHIEIVPKEKGASCFLKKGDSVILGSSPSSNGKKIDRGLGYHISRSMIQFTTATGDGREASVIKDPAAFSMAEDLLLHGYDTSKVFMFVNTSTEEDAHTNRKAIFSFDLKQFKDRRSFSRSVLFLSHGPTGLGYATLVPDADFTVYGLIDETYDNWNVESLDWQSFPGNVDGSRLDPAIWQPVGRFSIKQGTLSGVVQITSDALDDLIRQDSNSMVTFAIVRDTCAGDVKGLVHGFATQFHPELPPPRLQISY